MIIVTGSIQSRPEDLEELLAISLEHVHRSRAEPGCVVHSVHQNVEDALTVVFFEQWKDRESLAAHFAVAASRQFVSAVTALATTPPTISIYEATAIEL
jgi:quinol monooxygenase YgiN